VKNLAVKNLSLRLGGFPMSASFIELEHDAPLGAHLEVGRMPAHWLMARLGKRVLRPGGIEMTRWLLENGRIESSDDVIELAPGLGVTAAAILTRGPRSYVGVERDREAARIAEHALARAGYSRVRLLRGDAARVSLPDGSASVILGEAMLSMQTAEKKQAIAAEARRLLRPGGRYLIHELAVEPDGIDPEALQAIQKDLSATIHVGVRIGTLAEWKMWLGRSGFTIESAATAPMRLLEPERVIRDEGVLGAARFVFNALRTPGAVQRLADVRRAFRTHRANLCGVAIVARRPAA
jgi:SAM-dependent methyltransferase